MYPLVPEILRAIRQNVTEQLVPALATDYAREQAGGVLLLIEHLLSRWDRAASALREEHDDLHATLAAIAAVGGAPGARGDAPRPVGLDAGGAELVTGIRELRARLAAVIASAPENSPALAIVHGFCERQLARDEAAVAVGALTWE